VLDLRTVALKPVEFIGSSKKDLSGFPDPVKQDIGHALFVAQQGGRAPNAKALQGFGGGSVVEIVEDHDGDTYRCVYTTRLKRAIYVLHAFQKKSKRGRRTPKHEVDLVQARLKEAEDRDRQADRSQG
jgi:phage-related protein